MLLNNNNTTQQPQPQNDNLNVMFLWSPITAAPSCDNDNLFNLSSPTCELSQSAMNLDWLLDYSSPIVEEEKHISSSIVSPFSLASLEQQVTALAPSTTVCTNIQNGALNFPDTNSSLVSLQLVHGKAQATGCKNLFHLHVTLRFQGLASKDISDVYAESVNGISFVAANTHVQGQIVTCTFHVPKTNYKLAFTVRNANQMRLAGTGSFEKMQSIKEANKQTSKIGKQCKTKKQ